MKEELKYSCDVCENRLSWDREIIWLNSSYGVCPKCYDNMTEKEREEKRTE